MIFFGKPASTFPDHALTLPSPSPLKLTKASALAVLLAAHAGASSRGVGCAYRAGLMTAAAALIPGLDEIVHHSDPARRAEAARRIAELFFEDAAKLRASHVALFDDILIDLVPYVETVARAELAERFSLLANAPRALLGQLARENEILVAGPVLRRSPVLDEDVLLEVARLKGRGHLLAMAERNTLSTGITDVMVRRGDREVVRRTAGNAGAAF